MFHSIEIVLCIQLSVSQFFISSMFIEMVNIFNGVIALFCNVLCTDRVFCLFQCLLYRTEHAQDVKKIEKFTGLLMRHMASKDSK